MSRVVATLAVLLVVTGSAEARNRIHHRRSEPIIAGQPSVRVTPSGNVIAPTTPLPARDINGKEPLSAQPAQGGGLH